MLMSVGVPRVVVLACGALAGCGSGAPGEATPANDAQAAACATRALIGGQIDHLRSLRASTATASDVNRPLDAIAGQVAVLRRQGTSLATTQRAVVERGTTVFADMMRQLGMHDIAPKIFGNFDGNMQSVIATLDGTSSKAFTKMDCA